MHIYILPLTPGDGLVGAARVIISPGTYIKIPVSKTKIEYYKTVLHVMPDAAVHVLEKRSEPLSDN